MARITQNKADGYVKISEGAAQVQMISNDNWVGVIHSAIAPDAGTQPDFIIKPSGIEYSLGSLPCYMEVQSNGDAVIAVQDIS